MTPERVVGGRYRLLASVGRGGMGAVWRAHDEVLDRDVAVKEVLIPPGLGEAERDVFDQRTLREARSAARLSHPGIVTVHDVVYDEGRPWIVMQFVPARSLQGVIDADGPLPARHVAELGTQMLGALRTAHDAGILHRDVKPSNVLLVGDSGQGESMRAVLTDFGIATIEGDSALTQTGLVVGSPTYMAPERARGEDATPASDLWALGATLYTACEGHPPHDGRGAMSALASVLTASPAPPRNAGPLVPVLAGLLTKDPSSRMTAEEAADGLAQAVWGTWSPAGATWPVASPPPADVTRSDTTRSDTTWGVPAPDAQGTMPVPPVRADRRRGGAAVWSLVGLAVVVAAVVVGVVLFRDTKGSGVNAAPTGRRRQAAAGTTPASSPTPSPTPSLTPSATPSATTTPIPPGYHSSRGPRGSTVAVPDGWRREVLSTNSVRWLGPSGAHMQVDTVPWEDPDPVRHWRIFAKTVVAENQLPAFHQITLTGAYDFRGWQAADLEYTWHSSVHGTMHGYDRGFTADGRQFAILVAAPDERWGAAQRRLSPIFGGFRP